LSAFLLLKLFGELACFAGLVVKSAAALEGRQFPLVKKPSNV
jgi:hypothetical protein